MSRDAESTGRVIVERWLATEVCSLAECGTVAHELEQRALLARLIDEALDAARLARPPSAAMNWNAERRLRILAVMLARRRAESMGRAQPMPFNNETMLSVAVAPEEILEQCDVQSRLVELGLDLSQEPEALWRHVCQDIRTMFPREFWPAWLT